MTDRVPPLTPYPLPVLLGRVAREWETRRRIFDLPTGRFFSHDPAHDLSFDMGGRRPSTLLGPAAGPHTQLAQNFVIGWLAGARVFEAKTVQILDELEIDRPCIDMEAEGYNIEWSQELTLDQSLEEYVKAWMMLEILAQWEPLEPIIGPPGEHLFDLSIGYDLEGIRTERMDRFIRQMMDATEVYSDATDGDHRGSRGAGSRSRHRSTCSGTTPSTLTSDAASRCPPSTDVPPTRSRGSPGI